MKFKNLFATLFMIGFSMNLTAQMSPSVQYDTLEVVKFYAIDLMASGKGENATYRANGEIVSKTIYDKYSSTWEDMGNCCPCILKSYNEKDVLVSEGVACTDCELGYYKEFYPNGNTKVSGQYKENERGNWQDIKHCGVREGKWYYYNKKGKLKYIEIWKDGEFIEEQKPK